MGCGQAPVKRYNRRHCELIEPGNATPSFLASHELSLEEARHAYRRFDVREEGLDESRSKTGGLTKQSPL
jgi:glutathione-independent formaldehyde dehydrogenase